MPTPATIINGIAAAINNEQFVNFRPFSGGEIGGTVEGPDAFIQPLVQTIYNLGYSVDYKKSKSPISTLTYRATFSALNQGPATNPNLDFTDTWELVRNTMQKELLESDHPLVSVMSSNDISFLKLCFNGQQNIIKGTISAFFDGTGTPGTGNKAASIAAGTYLYNLWQAGVKTIPVKQPVLKQTRTTSPLYYAPYNVSYVDRVLSTATMLSDSGVPNDFAVPLLTLANVLMLRSGGLIAQARADGIKLNFGWLKELISSNKHGDKRIQYITEYQFGLWEQYTYGAPI